MVIISILSLIIQYFTVFFFIKLSNAIKFRIKQLYIKRPLLKISDKNQLPKNTRIKETKVQNALFNYFPFSGSFLALIRLRIAPDFFASGFLAKAPKRWRLCPTNRLSITILLCNTYVQHLSLLFSQICLLVYQVSLEFFLYFVISNWSFCRLVLKNIIIQSIQPILIFFHIVCKLRERLLQM